MKSVAFVFPGQGSQSLGMLDSFAQHFPQVKQTVDEASSVLDYPLWELIHAGPLEKLNETEYTQVAMLVADVAIYRACQAYQPFTPRMMAGHSLGEYAALVCGGALDFLDAVKLVQIRGQVMQKHVPLGLGAMAAIVGMDEDKVAQLCQEASKQDSKVMPANYNALGQVVVAGHQAAVEKVCQLAEEAGARLAKKIPVSVPCHCDLLLEAAAEFAGSLQQVHFKDPVCPIISNVDALPYGSLKAISAQLAKQLYLPVRWVQSIQYMINSGIELAIECGPGQVLSGLIKRIDRSLPVCVVTVTGGTEYDEFFR